MNLGQPHWKIRRRIIYVALIFCAACVIYVLLTGADSEAAQTIAANAFWLAGAVIGSYVFGAAWEDIAVRKQRNSSYSYSETNTVDNPDAT